MVLFLIQSLLTLSFLFPLSSSRRHLSFFPFNKTFIAPSFRPNISNMNVNNKRTTRASCPSDPFDITSIATYCEINSYNDINNDDCDTAFIIRKATNGHHVGTVPYAKCMKNKAIEDKDVILFIPNYANNDDFADAFFRLIVKKGSDCDPDKSESAFFTCFMSTEQPPMFMSFYTKKLDMNKLKDFLSEAFHKILTSVDSSDLDIALYTLHTYTLNPPDDDSGTGTKCIKPYLSSDYNQYPKSVDGMRFIDKAIEQIVTEYEMTKEEYAKQYILTDYDTWHDVSIAFIILTCVCFFGCVALCVTIFIMIRKAKVGNNCCSNGGNGGCNDNGCNGKCDDECSCKDQCEHKDDNKERNKATKDVKKDESNDEHKDEHKCDHKDEHKDEHKCDDECDNKEECVDNNCDCDDNKDEKENV